MALPTDVTLLAALLLAVVSLPFAAYAWDWLHGDLGTRTPRRTEPVDDARTGVVPSTSGRSDRPDEHRD